MTSKSIKNCSLCSKFCINVIKSSKSPKSPPNFLKIAKKPPVTKQKFCRQQGIKIANLAINCHFWSHCHEPRLSLGFSIYFISKVFFGKKKQLLCLQSLVLFKRMFCSKILCSDSAQGRDLQAQAQLRLEDSRLKPGGPPPRKFSTFLVKWQKGRCHNVNRFLMVLHLS